MKMEEDRGHVLLGYVMIVFTWLAGVAVGAWVF